MQGSGRHNVMLSAAVCAAFVVLAGCGGGNKLITSRDGTVESGELVLDSIPAAPADDEYVIGTADVLDVVFPFHRDFTRNDVVVRPDGRITLPYVGDVTAAGRTPSMLDSIITARYGEIIVDPDVAIVVKQFARQVIYVLGEVGNPGGYPYERGMTLLGALALGRGPTEKADANGVIVIRKIGPARIIGIQIDYGDIAAGKRFDLNVPLEAGDIVLVPKSKLAKTQDFANILYDILTKPMDVYLKGWQVANVQVYYDYYRRIGSF